MVDPTVCATIGAGAAVLDGSSLTGRGASVAGEAMVAALLADVRVDVGAVVRADTVRGAGAGWRVVDLLTVAVGASFATDATDGIGSTGATSGTTIVGATVVEGRLLSGRTIGPVVAAGSTCAKTKVDERAVAAAIAARPERMSVFSCFIADKQSAAVGPGSVYPTFRFLPNLWNCAVYREYFGTTGLSGSADGVARNAGRACPDNVTARQGW